MLYKSLVTLVIAMVLFGVAATKLFRESLAEYLPYSPASESAEGLASNRSGGHAAGEGSSESHAGGHAAENGAHHAVHEILVTNPQRRAVTLTERYVCQIHSRKHIDVRAIERGYLEEVAIQEGQVVKKGELMFRLMPAVYEAHYNAAAAEAQLAQVEYDNTQQLVKQNVVSDRELKLAEAKLAKANAEVQLARAELSFAQLKAPFEGIVDQLHEFEGSLIEEGAILTTLSDNSHMWVYFNVPEARYLEYQAAIAIDPEQKSLEVQLMLANGQSFDQPGAIGAIEADFNNETGNIKFRADFPNPNNLLRHGQTGTILVSHLSENAIVIPQRAMFPILAKTYVFIVDEHSVVHQREIKIEAEQDDIFLVQEGLNENDRIVFQGRRQVADGQTVECEFVPAETVMNNLKYHAE